MLVTTLLLEYQFHRLQVLHGIEKERGCEPIWQGSYPLHLVTRANGGQVLLMPRSSHAQDPSSTQAPYLVGDS